MAAGNIVFDLDGTLIDSAPDLARAASEVLAAEGLAPVTLAEVTGFIGHGTPVFVDRMMARAGLPPDPATHRRLHDAYLAAYGDIIRLTVPYPGVPGALATLAAGGWRMGLCTNKPMAPTRAALRHFGWEGLFASVTGGDSLPERKPDPAPLRACLAALGAGPSVYVGDSEVDGETAARAGVPFLLFTGGYRKRAVADIPHRAAFADWAALPALAREAVK
ncbi:MAG: phosphoglycolate phosphatase [Paracoccaceae bacterium]